MKHFLTLSALLLFTLPCLAQDDLQRRIEARERDLDYMQDLIDKAERNNDANEVARLQRDYNDTLRTLQKLRAQAGAAPTERRSYSSGRFIPADLVLDVRMYRLPSIWKLAEPLDPLSDRGPAVDIAFGISLELEPSNFFVAYHGFRSVDRATNDYVYVQQVLFGVKALDVPLDTRTQLGTVSFQLMASAGFTDFYAPGIGPDADPGFTISIEPRFTVNFTERTALTFTLMGFDVVWTDFNQKDVNASVGWWIFSLGFDWKY